LFNFESLFAFLDCIFGSFEDFLGCIKVFKEFRMWGRERVADNVGDDGAVKHGLFGVVN
jgi:hypothetical protein